MKQLNNYKTKMVLAGFVVLLLVCDRSSKANFTFGEATTTPWPPTNTIGDERIRISSDELTFYLSSFHAGGYGGYDLYVCTRSTTDDPWSEPENLGPVVNSSSNEFHTVLTSDGLELYFCSDRPGGYGSNDIWMTKRQTEESPWTQPVPLDPPANGSTNAWALQSISSDDLEMFFVSNMQGGYGGQDIWSIKRATRDAPWGAPVNAGPNVNSDDWDNAPVLLPDGLTLIFSSARLGGFSTMSTWNFDLWMAKRKTKDSPWGQAINLGPEVNTRYSEMSNWISADMRMLYFSYRSYEGVPPGSKSNDVWQAPIIPVLDLNSDGIVDSEDMLIMVEHWGEDYPLCDIGPMPLGDGVVDVRDMLVLTGYMSPAPIAHWKLDEAEGMFAVDSAGDNDALVVGNNSWQPGDGQSGGALQFNGTDGCAITNKVLNPAQGPFSVFAWINVGITGRVIISQQNVCDWLAVNAEGKLMTELKNCNGPALPLVSEAVITDGQWHRVGLVWAGSRRILYVNGEAVAEDTLASLESSQMGLYIGVDKNYAPNSFFGGKIDDIRIYDVALTAKQIEGLAQ